MRIYFEPQEVEFIVYRLCSDLMKNPDTNFRLIRQYEGVWDKNPHKNHVVSTPPSLKATSEIGGFPEAFYLTATGQPRYEIREDGKVAQVYEVS